MSGVTTKLIFLNIAFFIAQILFPEINYILSLNPLFVVSGFYWQLLTYMFLHGSTLHLFINMFVLYMFGKYVEWALNSIRFVFLYIISGVGSALFYIAITGIHGPSMIGASGAVFGILTAYAFLFPRNILVIFPGIPMPAYLLIIFIFISEIFLGVTGLEPGIANFGHVGGIITSSIVMLYFRKRIKQINYDFDLLWE